MKTLVILALSAAAFANAAPSLPPADLDTLQTKTTVQPLLASTALSLSTDRSLLVQPGVRASRLADAFSFSTYDNAMMELISGTERISLTSPVIARVTDAGLDFGNGKVFNASTLEVRRALRQATGGGAGQTTDDELKKMQDAAKAATERIKKVDVSKVTNWGNFYFWFFVYNFFAHSYPAAIDGWMIQNLSHFSPIGF